MKLGTLMICSIALTMSACTAPNRTYDTKHTGYTPTSIPHNGCTQLHTQVNQHPLCLSVMSTYTVMFAHGSASITPEGHKILDQAMAEIKDYQPRQVTVSGFLDTSNRSGFYKNLAIQREQAITKALMDRGISTHILGGVALGENRIAVNTTNGMQHLDNRHVVIDFRR